MKKSVAFAVLLGFILISIFALSSQIALADTGSSGGGGGGGGASLKITIDTIINNKFTLGINSTSNQVTYKLSVKLFLQENSPVASIKDLDTTQEICLSSIGQECIIGNIILRILNITYDPAQGIKNVTFSSNTSGVWLTSYFLPAIIPNSCNDSDNGINYEEFGKVESYQNNIFQTFEDSCLDLPPNPKSLVRGNETINTSGEFLTEYFCSGENVNSTTYECENHCIEGVCTQPPASENKKDIARYSERKMFLISDKNWQDVLPWVSASIWTSNNKEEFLNCTKPYGGAENVCAYPFLVYHEDNSHYIINYSKIEGLGEIFEPYNSDFYNDTLVYKTYEGLIAYNIHTQEKQIISELTDIESIKINGKYILFINGDWKTNQRKVILYNRADKSSQTIYNFSSSQWMDLNINENYLFINEKSGEDPTPYPIDRHDDTPYDIYYYDLNLKTKTLIARNMTSADYGAVSDNYLAWREYKEGRWYLNIHTFSTNLTEKYLLNNHIYDLQILGDKVFFLDIDGIGFFNIIQQEGASKVGRINTRSRNIWNYDIDKNKLVYGFYEGLPQINILDLDSGLENSLTEDSLIEHQKPKIWGDNIIFNGYGGEGDYKNNFYINNPKVISEIIPLTGIDVDSIVHFIQQYKNGEEKLVIIGNTTQEIDNILVTSPDFGAGLSTNKISRTSSGNYLSYWKTYKDIVYVEDNYELALVASSYASLINAPLIIQGSSTDISTNFIDKNIICVGSVNRICNENYDIESLQNKYLELTKTNKIILTNPMDWNLKIADSLQPKRSSSKVFNLYTKTSLLASILASAKHELLLTINSVNYTLIDNYIGSKMEGIIKNLFSHRCKLGDSCSEGFENKIINLYATENKMEFKMNVKLLPNLEVRPELYNSQQGYYDNYAPINTIKEVPIYVVNYGNAIAENVMLFIYSSNGRYICNESGCYPPVYELIGSSVLGNIGEHETLIKNISFIINGQGEHSFRVVVNSSNNEENTYNNLQDFSIIGIEQGPQLITNGINYNFENKINTLVKFSSRIINIGNEQASNVEIYLAEYNGYYQDSNGNFIENKTILDKINIGKINSKDSFEIEFIKTFDSVGYKNLEISMNSSNAKYPNGNSNKFYIFVEDSSSNLEKPSLVNMQTASENIYALQIPGFLFDCSGESNEMKVYFNNNLVKTQNIYCLKRSQIIFPYQDSIYIQDISYSGNIENLNITLEYMGNLSFYEYSSGLKLYKNWNSLASCSFGESCMPSLNEVLIENKIASSATEYIFNNLTLNQDYFIKIKISSSNLENASIYFNDNPIGTIRWESEKTFWISKTLLQNDNRIRIIPNFYYSYDPNNAYSAEVKINPDTTDNYLTIMAAPNVIPYKDFTGYADFYEQDRALDQTEYADLDGDWFPDVAAGRIQGITSSDTSSYLARDLFYDKLEENKNVKLMASSFDYMLENANRWVSSFKSSGFNAINLSSIENCFNFDSNEWFNQSIISYQDHGNENWAGIYYKDMPELDNSLVFNDACSTCASYDSSSFCNTAIRNGALAHLGAVCVAWTGNRIYMNTMNGMYFNNKSLGRAFTSGYDNGYYRRMTTLFGDPTLKMNNGLLNAPLEWAY